ncbi:hypothetical protein [Ligilactobacillus murinus]|uniref:Uncharacterized protein n=1 Tax=Ligilactobacillus murinus TaxID=1622 RepID=A0AAE7BRI2_9LACO|nr:hypothetical protein [Ligilactobacillus murinus]NEF82781.1 hypothetical protein [Ligilactobacillus murinus]NEF84850.1 hypothetical protein [Ligilactobacillus murinus]NEF87343.1 hypothetical protein [Ligilactobacillus murinus]NEF89462.1 hypothetical protein [Ligilactobacillus murinus]NEF91928.1 hypothetical protein [Ligilactobacillus murinus]
MKNIEETVTKIRKIASKRAQSTNSIPEGVHYFPGWCLIDTRNKMSEKEVFKLYLKSISSFPGTYLCYLIDSFKPHIKHFLRCIVYAYFSTITVFLFYATTSILSGVTIKSDINTAFDILCYLTFGIGVIFFCVSTICFGKLSPDRHINDMDNRRFGILTIISADQNKDMRIASAVHYSNDSILKNFFTVVASETNINITNLEVAYSRLSFLERILLVENSFSCLSEKR